MRRIALITSLCCAALAPLSASGGKEGVKSGEEGAFSPVEESLSAPVEESAAPVEVTVTGTVRVVGNMPFPELVITDSAGLDWFVDDKGKAALEKLQNQTVRVSGLLFKQNLRLANGRELGEKRLLREVRLAEKPEN